MTVTVSPIVLFNVEFGEPVNAELWDAITEKQLADWEADWNAELLLALQRLNRAGVDRKQWPQSRHWNWRKKTECIQKMLAYPSFSIMCDGMTQGMMILDTPSKRCRIECQKGKNLVYIEYLENAPWNRKELLFDPPRFRGIGSILILAAIMLSKEEGFNGRIGLHSLPQANSFYANSCGMTDLGIDPNYQGLHYFEMTEQQVVAFIAKGSEL
ncbi:MAG: hypothetical protein WC782_10600 [Methylococcaceae bacterium]|jgi:hypothetical protein